MIADEEISVSQPLILVKTPKDLNNTTTNLSYYHKDRNQRSAGAFNLATPENVKESDSQHEMIFTQASDVEDALDNQLSPK